MQRGGEKSEDIRRKEVKKTKKRREEGGRDKGRDGNGKGMKDGGH